MSGRCAAWATTIARPGQLDTVTVRVNLQPAYILHSRPYRDSSSMLEVLTAEYGRISLVARGARRRKRGGSNAACCRPLRRCYCPFPAARN